MPTIDLSLLPPPQVVESLDFETLFAERKAALIGLYPAEQREAIARTLNAGIGTPDQTVAGKYLSGTVAASAYQ
ncbi:hypothetical protein XIS1_1210006 [Xenorhabdus innexi]|uniref:Baseplate assembly protein n=1 Tax=Xenorhabdus innexi TaxID=290109 RepID=A0A1N6MRY0_9GAMM|nr:hypothetical protein XIS1_1210006 [Xenorhabdus innexi]